MQLFNKGKQMKLLVSALEHSANIHLKSVVEKLDNNVELVGIFDSSLGEPLIDMRKLSIMGFVDALKKLLFFFKLNTKMLQLAKDADKILLIDSSAFNLQLAKKIKKRYPDKEITYYILPQAWVWKKKRIPVLEKNIDNLCSILPFEKDYYSKNAPIKYVGHPLLDQITTFKSSLNKEVKNIVFMPGSRKTEIAKLMPIYHQVQQELSAIKATLIIPEYFTDEDIAELYGDIVHFQIVKEPHHALLNADFAFICSGTATLEASLIGTPFILSYIAKPLDFFIAKKFIKITHVGLANIMFTKQNKEPIHPEFLQEDVTSQNLLESFRKYDREEFFRDSKALREYLRNGSSQNVADILQTN